MKLLLDHCLPRRLQQLLPAHQVATAAEMGWDRLRNGKLLIAAAAQFEAVLTIDKKIKREQNLASLPVAVVVILAPTNRLEDIAPFVPFVEAALKALIPKTLVEITIQGQ